MAAFLKVDVLRAHAVPVLPRAVLGHAPARPLPPTPPRPTPPRSVLTAHWLVAPDGRLTCRWQTAVSAPFGPPPH
jgi:hypothetical protein